MNNPLRALHTLEDARKESGHLPDWYYCNDCNQHMYAGELGSMSDSPAPGVTETWPTCAHCESAEVEPVTFELIERKMQQDYRHPLVVDWYDYTCAHDNTEVHASYPETRDTPAELGGTYCLGCDRYLEDV